MLFRSSQLTRAMPRACWECCTLRLLALSDRHRITGTLLGCRPCFPLHHRRLVAAAGTTSRRPARRGQLQLSGRTGWRSSAARPPLTELAPRGRDIPGPCPVPGTAAGRTGSAVRPRWGGRCCRPPQGTGAGWRLAACPDRRNPHDSCATWAQ